ncbi:MAG: hypothetical protein ABI284_03770 [Nitrosospira sp.]
MKQAASSTHPKTWLDVIRGLVKKPQGMSADASNVLPRKKPLKGQSDPKLDHDSWSTLFGLDDGINKLSFVL